jgi:hypothetical protein
VYVKGKEIMREQSAGASRLALLCRDTLGKTNIGELSCCIAFLAFAGRTECLQVFQSGAPRTSADACVDFLAQETRVLVCVCMMSF